MDNSAYDRREEFEAGVRPVMGSVRELCGKHGIPYFATFAVASENGEYAYEREALTPADLGMDLPGCEVLPLTVIAGGGKAVPASQLTEIEYD